MAKSSLGTKATLVLDKEKEVMLYPIAGTSYKSRVKANKKGQAIIDTSASGDAAPAKAAEGYGPVSRGYREEIEHWAWCIQQGDRDNQPRCNGPVALADAAIALTSKLAIDNSRKKGGTWISSSSNQSWFDVDELMPFPKPMATPKPTNKLGLKLKRTVVLT